MSVSCCLYAPTQIEERVMSLELADLSDPELIALVQKGDEQALEVLLGRYYQQVYRLSFRLCGSVEMAQDITQESLVKAARGIRNFRGNSKFSTWMYRVTANAAADIRKSQARQLRLKEKFNKEIEIHGPPNVVNSSDRNSENIKAALSCLSEKERQAVVLTLYEGLSQAEVAKISECAETTIAWRVFMAKKKLRKYLAKANKE